MNRQAAQQLLVAKWLKDRIKEWEAQARLELDAEPGDRVTVSLNGIPVGGVTFTRGRKTVKVHDEDALLRFVAEHHPDEVETVSAIRPAFREKLLKQVVAMGGLVDPETGEVLEDIASLAEGEPYPSARGNDELNIVIGGMLAAGRIDMMTLKEIEK